MGLRLLQIGLGGWGRNWVQEVTSEVPGVEPVAWLDLDEKVRDLAATELGLPRDRLFATLDEVPKGLVDAALVTVPLAATNPS